MLGKFREFLVNSLPDFTLGYFFRLHLVLIICGFIQETHLQNLIIQVFYLLLFQHTEKRPTKKLSKNKQTKVTNRENFNYCLFFFINNQLSIRTVILFLNTYCDDFFSFCCNDEKVEESLVFKSNSREAESVKERKRKKNQLFFLYFRSKRRCCSYLNSISNTCRRLFLSSSSRMVLLMMMLVIV